MRTETNEKDISVEEVKADERESGSFSRNKTRAIIFIIISAVVFAVLLAADQLTKYFAVEYLEVGASEQIIAGALYFTLTYNSGMAFGFLSGTTAGMVVVTVFTVIIMVGMVAVFIKTGLKRGGLKIILAVVEAGAIGNFIDRIMMFSGNLSGVRDFLDISNIKFFGSLNFGICNVADFAVSLGGVALVIYMIVYIVADDGKKKKEEPLPPETADKNAILTQDYSERDVSTLEEVDADNLGDAHDAKEQNGAQGEENKEEQREDSADLGGEKNG